MLRRQSEPNIHNGRRHRTMICSHMCEKYIQNITHLEISHIIWLHDHTRSQMHTHYADDDGHPHHLHIYTYDPSPPIADLCGFELRKLFIRTIACALEHREHLNRCEEDSDWTHKQSNILCLWNLPASGILFAMKGDYTLRYN